MLKGVDGESFDRISFVDGAGGGCRCASAEIREQRGGELPDLAIADELLK